MATYYVNSAAGGTASGADWTNAFTTFAAAVAAATTDGDVIRIHYTHQDELAADTTYALAANISVISVNKDSSDAPTAMGTSGWIGKSATTSYAVTINVAAGKTAYCFGLTLRNAGTTSKALSLATANDSRLVMDSSYLWLGTTHASGRIVFGSLTGGALQSLSLVNPTFRFGSTSQTISVGTRVYIDGGSISSAGSAPGTAFSEYASGRSGAHVHVTGFDAATIGSSTLVGDFVNIVADFTFSNCKLGSGFVALATQTAGMAGAGAVFYNCDSGDVHYAFGHYNALGSCVAYTAIRANDAPTYDGTNGFSWRIDTSALASFYDPYVTPWISVYHSGTSAITPRLEILRDGSATAYDDDEVWGEFSYQGTTGYPISTIVNDRMTLLGTPAAQTTGMGTGSWTGEGGTAWSGKVNTTATITPAEIGELKARVCVGLASATVYVDPQIRTA